MSGSQSTQASGMFKLKPHSFRNALVCIDGGVKRVRIIGTRAVDTGTFGAAPGILTKASSGRNDLLTPQPTPMVSQDPSRSTTPVPSSSASSSGRSSLSVDDIALGPTPPPEPET